MKKAIAVLLAVVGWMGAGAALPFSSLRCGVRGTDDDCWPAMLAALKANSGAFDSVWFSTGVSYPPLAWHREQARRCAGAAADLRRAGLSASVEVQTTIGHGDAFLSAQDCSGRTWSTWTGWDGAVAKESGCPSDPLMQDYFVEVVRLHAAWKPDMIWIDDDFRLNNRAPSANPYGEPGCCCARCVKLFCAREGAQLTRAEIVSRCRTDAAFRARWVASQVATLCAFARKLAAAVREVSPETRMGMQFAAGGFMPEIAKTLAEASGNPVVLRPGAGAYWDTDPYEQIEKAYLLGGAKAGYDGCGWIAGWCPEIETCPRTFSCRTAQGILLEAFENLAAGLDFLSLFVVDSTQQESMAWYHGHLFRRLAREMDFLRTFRDACRGTRACGFRYVRGVPKKVLATRGIPILVGDGVSLGGLPDLQSIPVRRGGSSWIPCDEDERVMQTLTVPLWKELTARLDRTAQGRTPVLFDEPVRAWVLPRVAADGALKVVALVNASIDVQEATGVTLRGVPAGARVVWRAQNGPERILQTARTDAGDTRLTLPELPAWMFGSLVVAR